MVQLIVTRPRAQALAAVQELRGHGVDAVALPLLDIEPLTLAAGAEGGPVSEGAVGGGAGGDVSGDEGGDAAQGTGTRAPATLLACWARLHEYRLVMFVSANAVAHFFAAAPEGAVWHAHTLAGSTGPGTTAALHAAGVPPACVREPAPGAPRLDSEALWQVLRPVGWQGTRALIVRGEQGRDWLAQTLRAAGAEVGLVAAYRRTLPVLSTEEAALLAATQARPQHFAWHFSSSEAARTLPRLAPGGAWCTSHAYATHERIAQAVREIGFADVQLLAPGVQALVQAWLAAVPSAASAARK